MGIQEWMLSSITTALLDEPLKGRLALEKLEDRLGKVADNCTSATAPAIAAANRAFSEIEEGLDESAQYLSRESRIKVDSLLEARANGRLNRPVSDEILGEIKRAKSTVAKAISRRRNAVLAARLLYLLLFVIVSALVLTYGSCAIYEKNLAIKTKQHELNSHGQPTEQLELIEVFVIGPFLAGSCDSFEPDAEARLIAVLSRISAKAVQHRVSAVWIEGGIDRVPMSAETLAKHGSSIGLAQGRAEYAGGLILGAIGWDVSNPRYMTRPLGPRSQSGGEGSAENGDDRCALVRITFGSERPKEKETGKR